MALPPAINATIIDITQDRPRASDLIFVDTNVWYWFAYPRVGLSISSERQRIADRYLAYVDTLLDAQVSLCATGFTFNELASSIEGAERKIAGSRPRDKAFRYNPAHRARVIEQLEAAWGAVTDAAHWLDVTVTQPDIDAARQLWHDHPLDPTDALTLHALETHGIRQVLTDDGDFAAAPGIMVFTADEEVINAARDSGRLQSRS